jgi:hypothetical protein
VLFCRAALSSPSNITQSDASGRLEGRAVLAVTLDTFQLNGKDYRVYTGSVEHFSAAHKKRNLGFIGAGKGLGAALGAIAGGGEGALIGAASGAAAGTASRRHRQTRGRHQRGIPASFSAQRGSRVVGRNNRPSVAPRLSIPLGVPN